MIGSHNSVAGRPGWFYGLRVTHADSSCTFDVYERGGRTVRDLHSSTYRHTRTVRFMRDEERLGFEEVAQAAIDAANHA